jgi:small-conductance mechanosensitive channel
MLLLFAKAAGCSWTTTRELLTMYAANRKLTPDDITRSFERFKKLSSTTARSIVRFQEKAQQQRAQADVQEQASGSAAA